MSTTTSASTAVERSTMTGALRNGAVAGLAGGLVFGVMMAIQGMLPMVGMLIGQESATIGLIVHMLISAFIGAGFGLLLARVSMSWGTALAVGMGYGLVWWILGALVLMPLMLGMGEMVLRVGQPQWISLIGHVIFGLVTGAAFLLLERR